jgi:hypothetical protein
MWEQMFANHSRAGNSFVLGAVLGLINHLALILHIDHSLLGQGSPDDISGQIFHGGLVSRGNRFTA